jgi:hypothetical protein
MHGKHLRRRDQDKFCPGPLLFSFHFSIV